MVIVSGYFNPLHKGHLELFHRAKGYNHKLFVINKDKEKSELYKNKARKHYLDMHMIIQEYESELQPNNMSLFGLNIEDAYNKAYQFFLSIDEAEMAKKFTRFNNN